MKKFLVTLCTVVSASVAYAQGSPDVIPLGWIAKSYLTCATHHKCVVADPMGTALKIRSTPNGRPIGTIQNKVPVCILDQSGSWIFVGIDPQFCKPGHYNSGNLICTGHNSTIR